jgi:HK97 family phage prohead protease
MSVHSRSNLPIEIAMTHVIGANCQRQQCPRPDLVLATAHRIRGWAQTPEPCASCRREAVSLRGSVALCGACREQRLIYGGIDPREGRVPTAARASDEPASQLRGYAVVFNKRSVLLWDFVEIMRPSSVDRTLSEGTDLRALWNHNSEFTIGRVSAGTLTVRKRTRGLEAAIDPPTWAKHYVESIHRRDVTGMSFAFRALEDDWHLEEGMVIRDVLDMEMSEVSPVSFPAYPDTSITVGAESGRDISFLQKLHRTRMAR